MKKYLITIISIFFILINPVYAKENVKFSKCIDGDTIKVVRNGEKITVRLLAVDSPEIAKEDKPAEYYANEAAEFTCNKIKNAKKISLEYDKNSDKTDKYDRVLAWVYVDNELLQTLLVESGYAKVAYLYDDYKYADILKEKQVLASTKELGIWNSEEAKKYNPNQETNNNSDIDKLENREIAIIAIIGLIITLILKLLKKW